MTFIDIPGASGSIYRFRAWPEADFHPPIAGNFVVVGSDRQILLIGVSDDLSTIKTRPLPAGALYSRLNVSRATRTAEHEDLTEGHPEVEVRET